MEIELQGIHKRFGRTEALKGIDLKFRGGSIHGLVGENGAGKSTLMKILTGYQSRSEGRILLDGREVDFDDPAAAAAEGIGMLYQDPQDFPPLTVLDNFIVGRESHLGACPRIEAVARGSHFESDFSIKRGEYWAYLTNLIGKSGRNGLPAVGHLFSDRLLNNHRLRQRRRLDELAGQVNFHLDPEQTLEQLTIGERQQLEFLRLLGRDARVLILDEPTTGISDHQKERLFQALRQIRDQGRTVLLVSHKLEEVKALCDRVTILRHGMITGEEDAPFHIPRLLELMFDQPPIEEKQRTPRSMGKRVLSFDGVSASGERTGLTGCSLQVQQGEVVGLAGLSGSGQGLFLRLAAALLQPVEGEIRYQNRSLKGCDHRGFRAAGGAFLPADRLEEGLISGFTLQDHFALARGCNSARARTASEQAIEKFAIHGCPDSPVESLSGGNQQRLLLSLIADDANLILLENPTRGLDVESAYWVWEHLRGQHAERGAIIFSSAELDEILTVADRVLVFFDGRIVRDLPIAELDYRDVAAAMTGH